MSRIRVIALSMGLVIAALLVHSVSEAQGPGGQEGGGRGGRGGGFMGGGFGGFGSSLISLAMRPGVQVELKLTDKQKADVRALSDKLDARRKEMFAKNSRGRGDGNRGPEGRTGGPGARTGGPRGRGENPTASKSDSDDEEKDSAKGKTADAKGKTGNTPGKRGGPGGGGPGAGFANFRAMMAKQQAEDEGELAKILNATQRQRLLQIQLQQEGSRAFAKPDLQKKLGMNQTQIAQIGEVMEGSAEATRDVFRSIGDRNRGRDGDRERRDNDDPQVKAEREAARKEMQSQLEVVQDQTMQQIGMVLTKKQKLAYNKMLGEPFDRAKLDPRYDPNTAPKDEPSKSKEGSSKSSSKKKTTKARR